MHLKMLLWIFFTPAALAFAIPYKSFNKTSIPLDNRYAANNELITWNDAVSLCGSLNDKSELAAISMDTVYPDKPWIKYTFYMLDTKYAPELWLGGEIKQTSECVFNPKRAECWSWIDGSTGNLYDMTEKDLRYIGFHPNSDRTAYRSSVLTIMLDPEDDNLYLNYLLPHNGLRYLCDVAPWK